MHLPTRRSCRSGDTRGLRYRDSDPPLIGPSADSPSVHGGIQCAADTSIPTLVPAEVPAACTSAACREPHCS